MPQLVIVFTAHSAAALWFGEPVTRGILAKLPWLSRANDAPATALRAIGLTPAETIDAKQAFSRP